VEIQKLPRFWDAKHGAPDVKSKAIQKALVDGTSQNWDSHNMSRRKAHSNIVASSGNVFADLRLANAPEKQTKTRLAVAINHIIGGQQLSQAAAARRLKINQPKISALANYRLEGFSVERLIHFLTALDRDVEITIRPRPRSRREARILVTAACFVVRD
jgi:predicted XRE-type DNA-binding protein